MNNKRIANLANIIGMISIALLVYWVFTFILITVFDLKVFKENLTETFYVSVLAILALMFGSLMISIMFNMSSIAESLHKNPLKKEKAVKAKPFLKPVLIGLFGLITIFLFVGDFSSANKKKGILVNTAKQLSTTYQVQLREILDYRFTKEYIQYVSRFNEIVSKTDKNFNNISVIVPENIDGISCFLEIKNYYSSEEDKKKPRKESFIYQGDKETKRYLESVFKDKNRALHFSAHDGNYELYYPVEYKGQVIVLYFNDYQRYGKYGS